MRVNQAGLDLIRSFESLRLEAYQDQGGVWTIGWGTTARAGVGVEPAPGMVISEAEADWYFEQALRATEMAVDQLVTSPINENQFAAYVSLTYNIGAGNFRKSSTLRYFNAGDIKKAAVNLALWNKVTDPATGRKVKSNGLVRRRKAEQKLFRLQPVQKPASVDPASQKRGLLAVLAAIVAAILKLLKGKRNE